MPLLQLIEIQQHMHFQIIANDYLIYLIVSIGQRTIIQVESLTCFTFSEHRIPQYEVLKIAKRLSATRDICLRLSFSNSSTVVLITACKYSKTSQYIQTLRYKKYFLILME